MRALLVLAAAVALVGAAGCSLDTQGGLIFGSGGQAAAGGSSSTSTSGTGGTTTSSNGTGGEGNTGGFPPEDCLDGYDNDNNNAIDCDDPACQDDYECVPEVPANWTGFSWVDTSAYPSPSSTLCPGGGFPGNFYDTPGGPATCSACSCGAPAEGACSYPEMVCYHNANNCSGGIDFTANDNDGGCHFLPNFMVYGNEDDSCQRSVASQPTGSGSCPDSGGDATVPALWANQHRVCPLESEIGAGCGGGEVCVPKADPQFPKVCITRVGDHTCPGGWSGGLTWGSATDDRGCTACSCSAAQGVSCSGGSITVYDPDYCQSGGSSPVSVGSSCTDISNHADGGYGSYRLVRGNATGGSCSPSGGTPSGSVTPGDPLTICCQ